MEPSKLLYPDRIYEKEYFPPINMMGVLLNRRLKVVPGLKKGF
jgi:hypothetical protein